MAMLISRATGNFTSSSTWGVADSATNSQLTNPSASTNTTTSYVYSSTFTGTNTSVADGIVLFLKRLNTTGTVTVALSDDNGVTATREVTVNASDLPADESWVFFKFGTTLTLDGGTDYRVGVVASSADNALIYRDGTAGNWARMVSTTLTGAPAAGDTMLIVGEWTGAGASSSYTVTMDNTATTDFGTGSSTGVPTQTNTQTFNGISIGQNGTLTWGASAATNYYLKLSGNLVVWSGGAYNMGTSGVPCPRDSTMTLFFDGSSFLPSTLKGSVFNAYGQSRTSGNNSFYCKLSADAAANATSLTVDTDTGWLDNDRIAVATTTRTPGQSETGLLNGAAGASTLTVDGFAGTAGGLLNAHSGSSPTQAEIILLTRNVQIIYAHTSNDTMKIGSGTAVNQQTTAQVTLRWVEFQALGLLLYAVDTGFLDAQYCSFGPYSTTNVNQILSAPGSVNTSNCVFSNNVFFSSSSSNGVNFGQSVSGVNNVIQNNIGISIATGGATFQLAGPASAVNAGTFSNNTGVGGATGISIGTNRYTVSNLTAHSNNSNGVAFNQPGSINDITVWRTGGTGLSVGVNTTAFNAITEVNNFTVFGCFTANVLYFGVAKLSNGTVAGDSTFSSSTGMIASASVSNNFSVITMNNCNFSPTTGIYTAHTTGDIVIASGIVKPQFTLSNTALRASTEVFGAENMTQYGFIKSSKHDQTEGSFRSWFYSGVIERDTTIYNTAAPSERLTPSSASIKLQSGSRLVAVDDLDTVTINVYVRKSTTGDGADYNGNQPRLFVKANPACGIASDTLLDTMTASNGTWEQLTGTTAAVDADGALEFYVDCDGTVGWVNIDDWSVT